MGIVLGSSFWNERTPGAVAGDDGDGDGGDAETTDGSL